MSEEEERVKKKKLSWIAWVFLILAGVVFAFPMAFTILSSLKTKLEIFSDPFGLPETIQWKNYLQAWKDAKMSTYFINSIIQSLSAVVILNVVCSLAAYALSRLKFRWSSRLFAFFTLGMMIPMHTVLVPVAYMIGLLNLKNNVLALIMIYVAFNIPFSVMVMTNFMKTIPASLEEASLIDGASHFQIYRKIMLPLTVPATATISIFNFLAAWNNIVFPLIFINDKNKKPIALGLLNFNGEHGSDYGPLMAAIVITVLLPFVIYLLFQEKVEGGLAAGAVKG